VKLLLRAVVARALTLLPWRAVDAVRRGHLAAPPNGPRARVLFAAANVLRHRPIEPSITALRIEPLGITFSNDDSVLTRRLFFLGEYEAGEWRWWDHWCRRVTHAVEFGANTGLYTVVGGRVPTLEEYVAVEPHPHTAGVLRANLALNGVTRVRVVEAAVVGRRDQPRMELHVPVDDRDRTPTGAFLATGGGTSDGSRASIVVDVVEARTLVEQAQLIKMDIEGQELAVLRSIEDLLAERAPTIFLELRRSSAELRAYVPALCRRCGYGAFAIRGPRLYPVDLDTLPSVDFRRTFGTRDVILTTDADAASVTLSSSPSSQGVAPEIVDARASAGPTSRLTIPPSEPWRRMLHMRCRRRRWLAWTLSWAVPLLGCGDGGPGSDPTASTVIASVAVTPTRLAIAVGDSAPLSATPLNAAGRPVAGGSITWASGDTSRAVVSTNGLVRAIRSGTATITATVGAHAGEAVVEAALAPSRDTVDYRAIAAGVRPRGFGQGTYTLTAPAAGGRTLYVATTGSDANAGTSSAAPLKTIAKAAQLARAGDVVTIGDGTYGGAVVVANSGTAAAPIVFQAATRGGVVLTDGSASFRPATWSGGTQETGQLYVTVRGLTFRRYAPNAVGEPGPDYPAALKAARGWRVEDCLFDDAGNTGVQIEGSFVSVVRTTIQNSYFEALSAFAHSDATSVSDPTHTPLDSIRIVDVVLRGNYTLNRLQPAESADYSSKFIATRSTLIDNMESSENNGPGFWFDTRNSDFTIRNSYFHDNRNITGTSATGRGMNLEANWAPGLVDHNVFVNNASVGLAIANSQGIVVRNNLFVGNTRCVEMTNTDRGASFPLGDVSILGNSCATWTDFSAVHTVGDFTTPAAMRIRADGNSYQPGSEIRLAWWENRTIGEALSIGELRAKFGWETSGRIAAVNWP
jgi:FkbM family methyltransferase